jgi:hypothetical protein
MQGHEYLQIQAKERDVQNCTFLVLTSIELSALHWYTFKKFLFTSVLGVIDGIRPQFKGILRRKLRWVKVVSIDSSLIAI